MVSPWFAIERYLAKPSWLQQHSKQSARRLTRNRDGLSATAVKGTDSEISERPLLESDTSQPLDAWSSNIEKPAKGAETPKQSALAATAPIVMFTVLFLVFIFAAILTGQARYSLRNGIVTFIRPLHDPAIMRAPCGGNPEQARARNFRFDMVSYAWLPERCYDAELTKQFGSENKLQWFLDGNRTSPISREGILSGEFTGVYVSFDYHLHHCTAMWKKMHRALLSEHGRRAVDGYIGNLEHTRHCEKMLLDDRSVPGETINTRLRVKYPQCGI